MYSYPAFAEEAAGAGITDFNISFMAHTPALYEQIMGKPGALEMVTQGVRNQGSTSDSFTVQLSSEIPSTWRLELIDPATGNVIATDTNGDGVWDGGVSISTGPLAVGATKLYTVRATVPFGTAAGTQNTVELTATSALSPLVKDVGTDEVTILPAVAGGAA